MYRKSSELLLKYLQHKYYVYMNMGWYVSDKHELYIKKYNPISVFQSKIQNPIV